MRFLAMVAAVVLGWSAPASAIVFNLGDGSNTENTVSLLEGGLGVEVSGYGGFDLNGGFPGGDPNGTLTNINRNANGWGVNNGGSDLIDVGDALHFDFSPNTVTLLKTVIFELSPNGPVVSLFVDGVDTMNISLVQGPGVSTESIDLSVLNISGSSFTFATEFDAVRIQSIEVEVVGAIVPLPASGLLALGGLGGLIALRRRKAA